MKVTVDRAVIEQALEAMEYADACLKRQLTTKTKHEYAQDLLLDSGTALRTALEQPEQEQEPVAWMLKSGHGTQFKEQLTDELRALTWKGKPMWTPLYTAPPQRKPLTDEEIGKAAIAAGCDPNKDDGALVISLARAIEAAHGIVSKK